MGRIRLLIAVCVALLPAVAWAADKRVALVVGNSNYLSAPTLRNPASDAAALGDLFKRAGFDSVDVKTDVTGADFRHALQDFESKAADADIAVVYFAGHGLEVGGVNYLVPVDAKLATDVAVKDEAVPLDRVQDAMEGARKLRLVILDACRNDPFVDSMKRKRGTRAVTRGLAKVEADDGATLVAFAAQAGSTAADDNGGNSPFGAHSPYTAALLAHLTTPGLDLRFALGKVHDDVIAVTRKAGQTQTPYVYGALGGDVLALVPGDQPPQTAAVATETPPARLPPKVVPDPPVATEAPPAATIPDPPKRLAALPPPGDASPPADFQVPSSRSTTRRFHFVTNLDPNGDNWLALKRAPDVSAQRLLKMGPNTLLDITERRGPWLHVELKTGQTGWAYGKYVGCCLDAPVD